MRAWTFAPLMPVMLAACVVKTASAPPPATPTSSPTPTPPPTTGTATPPTQPAGSSTPDTTLTTKGGRPDSAAVPGTSVVLPATAATATPWADLPLPAGSTSPAVIAGGNYGAAWYLAGFHKIAGADRRWIVRATTGGELTALDAGEGHVRAAAPGANGSDFLLSADTWFGRFTSAGRVAAQATFKADVGGSEMYSVMPFGDGAVLVGAHNSVTSGETNGWLIAVDAAAKVRWELRPGKAAYHFLTGVALDRRGHLLAVGANKKSGAYQGWLVDVDKDGKLAGEATISSKTWDILAGIAVAGDEELYVTGKSAPYQDADGTAYIARRKSLAVETWHHDLLNKVVVVGPPIVHRATVEFLATMGNGANGSLYLIRVPRDGTKPTTLPVTADTYPIDWLMLPAWIVGTSDADTTIIQVRRGADGGVEWRTVRVARK